MTAETKKTPEQVVADIMRQNRDIRQEAREAKDAKRFGWDLVNDGPERLEEAEEKTSDHLDFNKHHQKNK